MAVCRELNILFGCLFLYTNVYNIQYTVVSIQLQIEFVSVECF